MEARRRRRVMENVQDKKVAARRGCRQMRYMGEDGIDGGKER